MLALTGATVVEAWAPGAELRPGVNVLVDGGRVAAVDGGAVPDGARVIDCTGCLVAPGLVCGHAQATAVLSRGMPGPPDPAASYQELLEKVWWRFERALDAQAIEAAGLAFAIEALLAGTTTVIDQLAAPCSVDGSLSILAEAFGRAGLRAALSYAVTDRHGADGRRAGLRESERFLRRCQEQGLSSPLRALSGAHAGFTLGRDGLEACAELARRYATGVHVQVAEDAVDRVHDGMPIVRRLEETGLLGPRTVIAHAVHVDEAGAGALRRSRCFIAHTARGNMASSVGYARPRRFGERVVLGTGVHPADLFAEAEAAYLRLREHDVDASPDDVTSWLGRGAELTSELWGDRIGSVVPGAVADLVVLDYRAPTPVHRRNLGGHVVSGLGRAHVRDVLVAGRPVVRNREVLGVDAGAALAFARSEAERIWKTVDHLG